MPLVKMVARISGFRDGVEWPERGGLLEVSDLEAADLVRIGLAVVVVEPARVETAVAPSAAVETATAPRRRRKSED